MLAFFVCQQRYKRNSTQNAPKLAFLSSKIEKFTEEGAQPPRSLSSKEETLLPTPYPLGAFGVSILAPTALDLGVYGASPPLATPSGSAPDYCLCCCGRR